MTLPDLRPCGIALLSLALGACSCSRQPADAGTAPPESATATAIAAGTGADAGPADVAVASQRRQAAEAMNRAASTLHAYLAAVAGKQWQQAAGFWEGGKPPASPGDEALRAIADMTAMRVLNDAPESLDGESPPRSIEVRVHLRVSTASGTRRIDGAYRLRRGIDGESWAITSASLRPSLD